MADLGWLSPDKKEVKAAGTNKHVIAARIALPIIALLLVALTFIWLEINPETKVKTVDLKEVQNTLETARFTSMDDKGRPFVIEANKVLQQDPMTMTATLDGPHGTVTLDADRSVSMTAQKGVYDHPNKKLYLNGTVMMMHSDGLNLTTDQMDVDLNDKSALSKTPVIGATKDGSAVKAEGLRVEPNGARLIFTGPAKLTIMPKEEPTTP